MPGYNFFFFLLFSEENWIQFWKNFLCYVDVIGLNMLGSTIIEYIFLLFIDNFKVGFPGGSDAMQQTWVQSLGQEEPRRKEWEFHGQRRLVGYSPWSCKESDVTEQLTYTHTILKLHKNKDINEIYFVSTLIHNSWGICVLLPTCLHNTY